MANSASGLVERFVNLFVQIWLYQYLIKRISPDEYSLYPIVTALMFFVVPLLVILTSGLARNTVEAHSRNDDRRVTEITSTMFPLLLAAALGMALLGLVVTTHIGSILNFDPKDLSEARLMAALMFGSLSLRLTLIPFAIGLYILQKFVVLNSLSMLQSLIRMALLFVLLLGAGAKVLWVVVASVAADILILLITTLLSVREVPALRFRFECIRWDLFSGIATFGFWSMISHIGVLIRKSSDLLILNRFASPIEVNTFHLASLTDNQIDAAVEKMREPLLPHTVALHMTGGRTALQAVCSRWSRYNMWAALLVATPLIAFRQQIWSVYLSSALRIYQDVPLVMVLLLVRYWIAGPISACYMAAYAMNRIQTASILVIASSLSNVAITVYFVHFLHMGAIGSALGTLVSVMIWTLFTWNYYLKLLGLNFRPWFKATAWRGMLPSAVAGLFALGWRYQLRPETIPELLLAVGLVAAVYVLSILLFCLDDNERRQLKELFSKLTRVSWGVYFCVKRFLVQAFRRGL